MAVEKKKIFEIEIPAIRQHIQAISFTKAELEGKLVKMDMTRMLKGKNLEANFMIKKKDDNLIGEFFSLNLLLSYIRRMMRKNISWIEDSFSCKSKDEKLRIKPFLISRKKIHRSVKAALRNKARELIIEYTKEKDSQEVFSAIVFGSLQRELAGKLKKVYPLALCEIRVCKIEK